MRDLRDAKAAFGRLAAGHRHRVVIENLVGDIDPGGRCGAQRQQSRMGVGAVPHVLKDMRLAGEGGLPDPGDAFAAHMRMVVVRRLGMYSAIPWQPMPAMARLPSGIFVDELCGHPEQK
jgi:hypothetical protein